ncbi:MAG: DUF4238 domain-containing protein [Alphaproteobacteria bacterium]|nr:DUF4238 domain-containing protein [Alphaproteobacteria bacterium]
MALDHFIPQVHLKNFYSRTSPHVLYATRKSDLKRFPCKAKDVCRAEAGSTNSFLREPRIVEKFLLDVEPHYNRALEKICGFEFDIKSVRAIAGFVAYINACAPAAMRSHSAPLKVQLETTAELLDARGDLPKSPPELGGKSLPELLKAGQVRLRIDPKFPQAMGIDAFQYHQSLFGNSCWEILINNDPFVPFLTSDFPVAIENTGADVINRIVPLSPNLAVRITPDISLRGTAPALSFQNLRARVSHVGPQQIKYLNKLIVRSAEDLVFASINSERIFRFVESNRHYRIDVVGERLRTRNGYIHVFTQAIVPYRHKT